MKSYQLTCITHEESGTFVSLCPELDVASQGETLDESKANLKEAIELFLESADPNEIASRLSAPTVVSPMEVVIG